MLEIKRTPLRVWGFLLTVLGGALIALGALLPWVSVGLRSDTSGALTTTSLGVDLRPGKVTLALGVLVVLAIAGLRLSHSIPLRRAIAVGVVVAGIVAVALAIRETTIKDHLLFTGARQVAEQIHAQTGLPTQDVVTRARAQLQKEGFADAGIGLWLTILGGVVAVAAGVLDLLWVRSRAIAHAHAFDAPPAG